jgi:hypothetical protein
MSNIKFEIEGSTYEIPDFLNIESYVKIFKIKDLFDDEYFAAKILNIVTGVPVDLLMDADYSTIQFLSNSLVSKFPKGDIKFVDRFELDGVSYGFIPNWKEMSFAEYVDIDTLITKKPEEVLDFIHVITAIMYRPIIKETKRNQFKIEKYDFNTVNERAELFKKRLDIRYFLGAQFFFINSGKKYLQVSQLSSTMKPSIWTQIKAAWKHKHQIRNVLLNKDSDGMQLSIDLLMTMSLDTLKFYRLPWWQRLINYRILSKKTKN